MRRNSSVPILARAHRHTGTAVVDAQSSFNYNDLLNASSDVARAMLAGYEDLREEQHCVCGDAGVSVSCSAVGDLAGRWRCGPRYHSTPPGPELEYLIDDSGASTLVGDALAHLPTVTNCHGPWYPRAAV